MPFDGYCECPCIDGVPLPSDGKGVEEADEVLQGRGAECGLLRVN